MYVIKVSSFIFAFIVLVKTQQFLQNPGFEQELDGSDWYCHGNCEVNQDTDAHTGTYSGRVTGRTEIWMGVSQIVPVESDTTYYYECWIKLLNVSAGYMYHEAHLKMAVDYVDSEDTDFNAVSRQPYLRPGLGWQKLAGDIHLGSREISSARFYVQVQETGVEYLVDTASLTKLTHNPNWKTEANNRIETIRKNYVTINLSVSNAWDLDSIKLEVNQIRHTFAFGSAVVADQLTGTNEDAQKYRDCYFENFEWGVLENAHKWRAMEWVQGQIVYPDEAVQVLRDNRIAVRGHCLFWGKEERMPPWVLELSADDLVAAISNRLNYTLPRYKGDVIHWDVNNEQIHGDFFENKTRNRNLMSDLLKEVHTYDEDAVLFLNDYSILNQGTAYQAMLNSAEQMRSLGAPLDAIGVQSHLVGSITPEVITAIQKRLEVLGKIGLPIWVTELDISQVEDADELADAYDDIITLYFSDPAMEGILLWGFHEDHHWRPDAAMFEGPDYTPNESGLRWQEMLRERWHSEAVFVPTSEEESFGFRGFHGFYKIMVKYEDNIILEMEFILDKSDQIIDVDI